MVAALFSILLSGCTRNFASRRRRKRGARQRGGTERRGQRPISFVAYGDTRFSRSADTDAANPAVRTALVHAIADSNPSFICFTGDIVYTATIKTTEDFRQRHSRMARHTHPVFPRLAITNFTATKDGPGQLFARFPDSRTAAIIRCAPRILFCLCSTALSMKLQVRRGMACQ